MNETHHCLCCDGQVTPQHHAFVDNQGNVYHQNCWDISSSGKIAEGLRKNPGDQQIANIREFVQSLGFEQVEVKHALDKDAVEITVHWRDATVNSAVGRTELLSNRKADLEVGGLEYATNQDWKKRLQEEIFGKEPSE